MVRLIIPPCHKKYFYVTNPGVKAHMQLRAGGQFPDDNGRFGTMVKILTIL